MKNKKGTTIIVILVIAMVSCITALLYGNKHCETPEYQADFHGSLKTETPTVDTTDEKENEEEAGQENDITNHILDTNDSEENRTEYNSDINDGSQNIDLGNESSKEIELPFIPAE